MDDLVVLRAPMRSRRGDVDPVATVAHALASGVVGTGSVDDERAVLRLQRFEHVPDGSYVWTRTEDGLHLGTVSGPLGHDDSPAARSVDLPHVRPCRWLPGPVDPALVPAQVTYSFSRGGLNLQRIGIDGALDATARTWRLMS